MNAFDKQNSIYMQMLMQDRIYDIELETLDQMNKACSDVETYLQSLDKAGVINECMNALRQCDVLEHTLACTEKNVAQQRLFYDGMRRQLLENGHALVADMDQTELLHYCVEILGGFVHE